MIHHRLFRFVVQGQKSPFPAFSSCPLQNAMFSTWIAPSTGVS